MEFECHDARWSRQRPEILTLVNVSGVVTGSCLYPTSGTGRASKC